MNEKPRTIPEVSIETRLLYQRLVRAEIGEVINYKELTEIIGRPAQEGGRGVLSSARRMAIRENKVKFGTITNVGLKRLNDSEIVAGTEHRLRHIGRTARRGLKDLACATGELSHEDVVKHNTGATLLAMLLETTRPHKIKRLEGAVATAQDQLPLAKTLEAMKG